MVNEKEAGAKSRRKRSWDLLGSRPYVESLSDIEKPATSWPRRKSD